MENGVPDGARTRDARSHSPVLYQLSYRHHLLENSNLKSLPEPMLLVELVLSVSLARHGRDAELQTRP